MCGSGRVGKGKNSQDYCVFIQIFVQLLMTGPRITVRMMTRRYETPLLRLGANSVAAETHTRRFAERVIRQVRSDSSRAMLRARYCHERSEILHLRCVDDQPERSSEFGTQLWYFEGMGVDEYDSRHLVYGVMEYSVQYGLQELVDDGVFESEQERDRFRSLYQRDARRPSWHQPAHRWLVAAMISVAAMTLATLLVKRLIA